MKRLLMLVVAISLAAIPLGVLAGTPAPRPEPVAHPHNLSYPGAPAVTADAAAVMDVGTGVLIYAKDAHRRRAPASLTKIVTAMVAVESAHPLEIAQVSGRAAATGGSRMGLHTGDRFTMVDMLSGLLLESGNDAAVAIAEHVGGSVERFSRMMTDRAWILGADRTIFANPHGLTFIGHLSTARDMCVIGRAALRDPLIARLVATGEIFVAERTEGRTMWLKNTNRLIFEDKGVTGMKTGTTPPAGNCLMFAARRGDREIVGVVLHSEDRYGDARRLIDHAFSSCDIVRVIEAESDLLSIPVNGGWRSSVTIRARSAVDYPMPAGDIHPRISVDVQRPLIAPVRAGDAVGTVMVSGAGGSIIAEAIAAADVPARPALWRLKGR